jgi:hypothetical protein
LISLFRLPALALAALLLAGCYHMRVTPEPILPCMINVRQAPAEALTRIRKVLADELHIRIVDEQQGGSVLISAPHHFYTDTGFGQPAGGRKYYIRLMFTVEQREGRTFVTTAPYSFELRTSYAYSEDGQMRTLFKVYPYEEYPGMFDTDTMTNEVRTVAGVIERAMKE